MLQENLKENFELQQLVTLELNNNQFTYFSDGFFDNLNSLSDLKIANNPLYCDCSIIYLIKYLDKKRSEKNIAPFMKCTGGRTTGSPIEWRNALIRDMKPGDMYCPQRIG